MNEHGNVNLQHNSSNITLYAYWTQNTYTISYDVDGVFYGIKFVTYGSTYGDLPTPIKEGYIFVGWFDNTASLHDSSKTYKDNPLNYYADKYDDLYNAFGYNSISLYSHYVNSGKTEGRKISQYSSTDTVSITSDKTLYAGWIKKDISYKVVHELMNLDGSTYTVNTTEYMVGTIGESVTPNVKSYTGFTAPSTQTVSLASDGNIVITYRYSRNKYQFTLGESSSMTTTGSTQSGLYYYGTTITLSSVVKDVPGGSYNSSKFKSIGWRSSDTSLVNNIVTGSDATSSNTTFVMPAGNIKLSPYYQFTMDFEYKEDHREIRVIEILNGTYEIELWGAQGGSGSSYIGGYGGYTKLTIINKYSEKFLQVMVGGAGIGGSIDGGYNGGAGILNGQQVYGAPGGGATSIVSAGNSNVLKDINKNNVIAVAGGGGGGSGIVKYSDLFSISESYMYCYNCTTYSGSNRFVTTYSTTCASSTPTSNCSKIGNGYARINFTSE